jgi:hypothetical protein
MTLSKHAWPARIPSVLIGVVFCFGLATGCAGSGVRSTGASLPVDAENFDDGTLRVSLSHSCPGVRCDSVKVSFENLGEDPLTVNPKGSRLLRAGQGAVLQRSGEAKGPLVIPAKASVSESFVPTSEDGKTRLSYTRPKAVWCSLKSDTGCKDVSKAEAACAGFARYYYETYMSTGGWLSFSFAYETGLRKETLVSPSPRALAIPPAVVLEEDSRAPWFVSNPDDVVFYKIACDEKCSCKEVTPRRNFFLDDKMRAEFGE